MGPTAVEETPAGETPDAEERDRAIAGNRRLLLFFAVMGGAVLLLGVVATLGRGDGGSEWAGRVLDRPQDKPPIVLADTDGRTFDLQAETEGVTTVLMFGYANCPDICPISLATLDSALEGIGDTKGTGLRMVFVSVDPQRDSPEALRAYLDRFNPAWVGLTGTPEQLAEAQRLANVPQAARDPGGSDDEYTVGHATQMIVYNPDGKARVVYPFGTRQTDWNRDLPRLLAGEVPA